MAMSRKNYEAIAAVIKNARDPGEGPDLRVNRAADDKVDEVAKALAVVFADDSPRFDMSRFLAACGVV